MKVKLSLTVDVAEIPPVISGVLEKDAMLLQKFAEMIAKLSGDLSKIDVRVLPEEEQRVTSMLPQLNNVREGLALVDNRLEDIESTLSALVEITRKNKAAGEAAFYTGEADENGTTYEDDKKLKHGEMDD